MTKLTPSMLNQMLEVLVDQDHWCQHHEAETSLGEPCSFDDKAATRWCVCGAACKTLDLAKAFQVYPALLRVLTRETLPQEARSIGQYYALAFARLSEWNDRPETTWLMAHTRLRVYRDLITPTIEGKKTRGRPRKCAVTV